MNKKETFEHLQHLGLTASKAELTDNSAIVHEAYNTYLGFLKEEKKAFSRPEFMELSKGWRKSLQQLQAAKIPTATLFFEFAQEVRERIRLKNVQKRQNQAWSQAVDRCSALLDVCEDLKGETSEPLEDIIDMTTMLKQLIEQNQIVDQTQLDKIERYEGKILQIYENSNK